MARLLSSNGTTKIFKIVVGLHFYIHRNLARLLQLRKHQHGKWDMCDQWPAVELYIFSDFRWSWIPFGQASMQLRLPCNLKKIDREQNDCENWLAALNFNLTQPKYGVWKPFLMVRWTSVTVISFLLVCDRFHNDVLLSCIFTGEHGRTRLFFSLSNGQYNVITHVDFCTDGKLFFFVELSCYQQNFWHFFDHLIDKFFEKH